MPGRVLVYTDSHSGCGVGINMAALMERLVAAGYAVFCAQRREQTALQSRLTDLGVRYQWFERNPDDDFSAFANDRRTPERLFAEVRPDIIFFMNGHPLGTFGAIATALAGGLPYVIREGVVAPHFLPGGEAQRRALKAHYLGARAVMTNCAENLQHLRKFLGVSDDFGHPILNGAADKYFMPRDAAVRQACRAELGVSEDDILCFTAAMLESAKGYQYQLGAYQILRDQPVGARLKFAWAGEGTQREFLEKAIVKFGLESHVSLLGQLDDVTRLLDAADIFVFPSESEGLPAAILEAMAKGVPVIAADVGGISEGLGDCGLLLPRSKDFTELSQALAAALAGLAPDGARRREIGARGRARASAQFTRTRMMAEILAVIEAAMAPG